MDDSSLRDYRSDISGLRDDDTGSADIQASAYHQEINTLKIEKLSQRVTIITIIIPCIIIAVLAFAYIDMKERVVDVDETKGNQVTQMAEKLEEKLNALDVRIAKAKFELDEKLPRISQHSQALENQIAKIDAAKADLAALTAVVARIEKIDKRLTANSGRDKSAKAAVDRINKELLAAIKENNARFKNQADKISQDMQLFREEFDARLLELTAWEEQIALLGKQTSLLDKQMKTVVNDARAAVSVELDLVRTALEQKILDLEGRITAPPSASGSQSSPPAASDAAGIAPVITPATKARATQKPATPAPGISEEPLTQ